MSNKARSLKGSLEALLPGRAEDPQRDLLAVARELYVGLDTPISLGLEILLRYGELEQVVRKRINPLDYNDLLKFRLDYQAVNFLAKAPLKIQGVDPQAQAVQSFFEAEEACKQTNHRLRVYRDSPASVGHSFHSILHGAAKIISSTLGTLSSEELLSKARFGPGADSTTQENRTSAYDKMLTKPEATRDAIPLACMLVNEVHGLQCAFGRDPHWGPQQKFAVSDFEHVRGNRITFVPKSAVTFRTIAIEPHLNIYMQLGVGAMIRRKLRQRGLDLDSQEGNQFLARYGSQTGKLSTIDLSSASDTLSRELVRELLPEPWYNLMDALRSKVGLLKRGQGDQVEVVKYEKFSSMGNGFTFELETLIFWALAKSVVEYLGILGREPLGYPTFRVYGDDIVVPTAAYQTLVEVLAWCGFSTNDRKSFTSGYFRESCGKDYFEGTLVRPFFQKELPSDVQALYRIANGLRRAAFSSNQYNGCDSRYTLAWNRAVRCLPKAFRGFKQPAIRRLNSDELASYFDQDPSGFLVDSYAQAGEKVSTWSWRYNRPKRPWETGQRGRFRETPSVDETPLVGFCRTDDSVALVSNQDEALGSSYCRLKVDPLLQRSTYVTMAVRAKPRGFEWDTSRVGIFGVLLYETRVGRELALGSRSVSRGTTKPNVVWLHWEQWRDMGPWQ